MVGVPSSKSCFGCLERRKRCDSSRPGCRQCEIRGVICPGYRARFRFVAHNLSAIAADHDRRGLELPYSAVNSAPEATRPDNIVALQLLPRNLHSTAGQLELLGRFEDIYKPRCQSSWRPLSTDLSDLPSWEWMLSAMQCCQSDTLLNDVVLALILGTVGRCKDNRTYLQASSVIHTRALRNLQRRLQSSKDRGSDYTLAAVTIFGMYEIQIGTESRGNAWLAHVQGFEALLQLRGSSKPVSDFAKPLIWAYLYNRWVVSIRGRGKPGTEPSPIVFEVMSESDPPDVQLFSLLHRIAPLMGKVDRLIDIAQSCCQHQKTRIASSLLSELYELELELSTWPRTVAKKGMLYWEDDSVLWLSCSNLIPIPEVFAKAVFFPSVRVAISMLFYWTGLLFIHILRDMLKTVVTPEIFPISCGSGQSPGKACFFSVTSETSATLAMRMSRSLEYFLHPDLNHLGTYLIGFPLGVTQTYFEARGLSEELSWLKVINTKVTEMGSSLSDFVKELRANSLSATTSASVGRFEDSECCYPPFHVGS